MSNFVFDTRDLSTIRGGSLLLLKAARENAKAFLAAAGGTDIEEISIGASIALLGFTPKNGKSSQEIGDGVAEKLRNDPRLKHATFVVDVEPLPNPEDGLFRDAVERVLSRNLWRQYQSSTVSLPVSTKRFGVCQLDGVRPSNARLRPAEKDKKRKHRSASVVSRRRFGQQKKQKFYEDFAGRPLPKKFAREFEHIAEPMKDTPLGNKMAVFYADGNKFSSILVDHCKNKKSQIGWDKFVREKRAEWLKDFLEKELSKPGWLNNTLNAYRFETLLWGGDEVMFVMPAWMGWSFAAHFFGFAEKWNLKDPPFKGPDKPLTHTAALVFCHQHAPIHRIKNLLKEKMVELGKEKYPSQNLLLVQVLESFDHLGGDFDGAVNRRAGECCKARDLILRTVPLSETMRIVGASIESLHSPDFPRSQLRTLINNLIKPPASGAVKTTLDEQINIFAKGPEAGEIEKALRDMHAVIGHSGAFWFHLEELWDYAQP